MNEFKLSARVVDGIGALMQNLMDNKPIGGVFSLYSQFNAEIQGQLHIASQQKIEGTPPKVLPIKPATNKSKKKNAE